jgi:arylsulfatase A-like enzyme
LCTATRQSLLTGRLPHSIGVTQLQTPLPDETVTLAEVFKENGYDTAAFGKMHFNSARKHGFDIHLDLADHNRYRKENPARPVPAGIGVLPPWKPFRDPAAFG